MNLLQYINVRFCQYRLPLYCHLMELLANEPFLTSTKPAMTRIPSRNLNDLYDKGYQALDKDVVHIEYNLEPDQAYVP